MVKVLQSDAQAHRLDALLALFKTKWPDFESSLTGERFPSPLLLLLVGLRSSPWLHPDTSLPVLVPPSVVGIVGDNNPLRRLPYNSLTLLEGDDPLIFPVLRPRGLRDRASRL